jgi:hypothetical protein
MAGSIAKSRVKNCLDCARFFDQPADIEARIPNLTLLGSAYASVRGSAGVCEFLGRFMDPVPASSCAGFTRREELIRSSAPGPRRSHGNDS